MKKFEYTSFEILFQFRQLELDRKEMDEHLTNMGKEGWEMISVITENREDLNTHDDKARYMYIRTFYFKREIN